MRDSLMTSLIVVVVGAIVTLIGMFFVVGRLGAGITGFGLAHIILGLLDMVRPSVRAGKPEPTAEEEHQQ